jgi:hypothetical protein
MDGAYGEKVIIPGVTYVVDTVTGRTGKVYKLLPKFGVQVWTQKDQTRQNWFWSMITVRTPRSIKRYPRPLRFPRDVPSEICHCPSGREEVEGASTVRCLKCRKLIGSESFPKRIRRAEVKLRKCDFVQPEKTDPRSKVQKRKSRPSNRKAPRGPKHSINAWKKNPSRVRRVHGGRIGKNKAQTKRAAVPKKRPLSRSQKVSTPRRKAKIGK